MRVAEPGYVGLYAALRLERALSADEAELTVVDPENFMVYRPLLADARTATVEVYDGERQRLRYDHLVVGVGATDPAIRARALTFVVGLGSREQRHAAVRQSASR